MPRSLSIWRLLVQWKMVRHGAVFHQVTAGSGAETFPYPAQTNGYPSKTTASTSQTGDHRFIFWKPLKWAGSKSRDNEYSRWQRWINCYAETWDTHPLSLPLSMDAISQIYSPSLHNPLPMPCRKLKDPSGKNKWAQKETFTYYHQSKAWLIFWLPNTETHQEQSPVHMHRMFNCLFSIILKYNCLTLDYRHLKKACNMKDRD